MEVESSAIFDRSSVLMEVPLEIFFREGPFTFVPLIAFYNKQKNLSCPESFYSNWKQTIRLHWNSYSPVDARRRRHPSISDFTTP